MESTALRSPYTIIDRVCMYASPGWSFIQLEFRQFRVLDFDYMPTRWFQIWQGLTILVKYWLFYWYNPVVLVGFLT
jgi:hypothetical protein